MKNQMGIVVGGFDLKNGLSPTGKPQLVHSMEEAITSFRDLLLYPNEIGYA